MRRHHSLALTALLALARPALAEPPASSAQGDPRRAAPPEGAAAGTLATLDGVVRAVDLAAHKITLDVNGSEVVLGVDRNTLVYLPAGLSTVFALRPGDVVRAGRDAGFLAYWVQVRSSPAGAGTSPPTPGQGTGPGGGAAPPHEGTAGAASGVGARGSPPP